MANSTNSHLWGQRWPAPAKLNLLLKIVGRREDGYHLLQTVFQFVDWCDWLSFHPVDDGNIHLQTPLAGVVEAENLIVRAAKLLQSVTGCTQGVAIALEKNLPMGGGLGGGSSDAATALVALNELWGLHLPEAKLLDLGLTLGADVPVFIFGHSAWAEGVGERLKHIELPEQWTVILKPDCHVETRAVFSAKDLTRNSKSITMTSFVAGEKTNDCLTTVTRLYPEVAAALAALGQFAEARLTGTGSCVFAQFPTYEAAESAHKQLKGHWQSFLAKGVNRSPLRRL